MITGDHPATADAIARQTGLALGDAPVARAPAYGASRTRGGFVDRDGIVLARIDPRSSCASRVRSATGDTWSR